MQRINLFVQMCESTGFRPWEISILAL